MNPPTANPSHRTLFTLLGVPWQLTPTAWAFIPTRLAFGLFSAWVTQPTTSWGARLSCGGLYTLLLLGSQGLHILGHTLSSCWVGAPITANLIEALQITTYYAEAAPTLPRRVHLGRTVGGPLLNALLAGLAFGLWRGRGGHVWRFTVAINLFLAAMLVLPFKGVDGEIFWRELRRPN